MTNSHSYILVQHTYFFCDGHYVSYGIALIDPESPREITEVVSDLSCDRAAVTKLVERCNALQLSPVHFRDVMEDFLS